VYSRLLAINVVLEPTRVRGEVCRGRTFYFPNFLFGTDLISGEFFFRPPFHFSSLISGLELDFGSLSRPEMRQKKKKLFKAGLPCVKKYFSKPNLEISSLKKDEISKILKGQIFLKNLLK